MNDVRITRLHYGAAATSFVVAFFTFLLTMQPTVPFWDCGEFAAAAWALQIPHPPGAPLWTLVGRIGMLVPTFTDPVARYNLLSVLASAATVALLYLTLVKLVRIWRTSSSEETFFDALITTGAAFVGALAFTWSDSFWFNAVECEVYAFGTLFIALVLWLVLLWHERADEPGSERYLLLIAYVIGLSLGVHQLALLTIFPVFMIVYYRRRSRTTALSWLGMVVASVVTFVFIFVVLLTKLVTWAGSGHGLISILVLVALLAAAFWTQMKRKPTTSLVTNGLLLVFLGYTTYTVILVRAGQDPPMNQNVPSNLSRLGSYINRDQYGDWKLLPRRLPDQKEAHPETWTDYHSDFAFFLDYQTNFMFNRYLAWNFIGRQDDDMGAGVDPLKTFGLPFLLGLFGLYWHFRRDPKRALTLLAAFLFLGYLTAWYQNQQEPQPRERDYFYVGAFYIYAMWIAIGATGILEVLRGRSARVGTIVLALAGIVILVPLNQVVGLAGLTQGETLAQSSKWAEYSRRNNRVPFEYAYNILQSCEQDAILFTYGDNDTFPLWCLQDVYGIRRDVRIVQLQLANAMTYCRALGRTNDWGAKPIRLSAYSDSVVNLPDAEAYPIIERSRGPIDMQVPAQAVQWIMGTTGVGGVRFKWAPEIHLPSDLLVSDIVANNLTSRPIYYSVTVPESERAGLNSFLVYEGLVARVTPLTQPLDPSGIGASIQARRFYSMLFDRPRTPAHGAQRGLMLYTYSDPDANLSSMDKSYAMTYRLTFLRFTDAMLAESDMTLASAALDTMEARIPVARVPVDYPYASLIADIAEKSANWRVAKRYAQAGVATMKAVMSTPNWRETDRYAGQTDPDILYADLLARAGAFGAARTTFETLLAQSTGDRAGLLALKLEELEAREAAAKGDAAKADSLFHDVLTKYDPKNEHRGAFLELWNWIERPPAAASSH